MRSSDHARMRPANTRRAGPAQAQASATAEGVISPGRRNHPAAARSPQHHRHDALSFWRSRVLGKRPRAAFGKRLAELAEKVSAQNRPDVRGGVTPFREHCGEPRQVKDGI